MDEKKVYTFEGVKSDIDPVEAYEKDDMPPKSMLDYTDDDPLIENDFENPTLYKYIEKEPDKQAGKQTYPTYEERKATFNYLRDNARGDTGEAQEAFHNFIRAVRMGDKETVHEMVSNFMRSYDSVEDKPFEFYYHEQGEEVFAKALKEYEERKAAWDALQKQKESFAQIKPSPNEYYKNPYPDEYRILQQNLQLMRSQGDGTYNPHASSAVYQHSALGLTKPVIAIVSPDEPDKAKVVENGANLLLILQSEKKDSRWMSLTDIAFSSLSNDEVEIRKGAKPLCLFTNEGDTELFYNLKDLKGSAIARIPELLPPDENAPILTPAKLIQAMHDQSPSRKFTDPLSAAKEAGMKVLAQEKKRMTELKKQYYQEAQKSRNEYDRRVELIKSEKSYEPLPKTAKERVLSVLHIQYTLSQEHPKDNFLHPLYKDYATEVAKILLREGMKEDDLRRALDKLAPRAAFDKARRKVFGERGKSEADLIITKAKAQLEASEKGFAEGKRFYIQLRKKLQDVVEKGQNNIAKTLQKDEEYWGDKFLNAYEEQKSLNAQDVLGLHLKSPLVEGTKALLKKGVPNDTVKAVIVDYAPNIMILDNAREKVFGSKKAMDFVQEVITKASKELIKEQAKKKSQSFSR